LRYGNVHKSRLLLSLLLLATVRCPAAEPVVTTTTIGPVTLRPGGFFELLGLHRSARTGTGIQTSFASVPLGPQPDEWAASPAHSRIALDASLHAGGNWLGYYESDFLQSAGRAPYRLRQLWVEYENGGWRILAGQAWSLLRPNRHGISSQNELMNTLVVEPGYHVGLAGRRNRQVRIVRDFGSWHAATAYEYREGGLVTLKLARDAGRAHGELLLLGGAGKTLGAGLSAVVTIHPRLQWVSQQLWSQGAGPHLMGPMPARVHAHACIQGLEASWPSARLRLFAYGGAAYASRSESNRLLRQWSVGFHHTLVRSVRWGVPELSAQYSRLERFTWPGGHGAMHTLSLRLRYSLPGTRRPGEASDLARSNNNGNNGPSKRR